MELKIGQKNVWNHLHTAGLKKEVLHECTFSCDSLLNERNGGEERGETAQMMAKPGLMTKFYCAFGGIGREYSTKSRSHRANHLIPTYTVKD